MRILIIHPESRGFGGAERVLEHFLQGMVGMGHTVTVAVAANSQCARIVPAQFCKILIPDNGKFSVLGLCRELVALRRYHLHRNPFDVIHGWAARDWELAGLLGWVIKCPALGTLHDHPRARFISKPRQTLMRCSAKWGLRSIACVSQAVRGACLDAGYPGAELRVVHNGLPPQKSVLPLADATVFRMGFLGLFFKRKGLDLLFEILDLFASRTALAWELHLVGEAINEAGRQLVAKIKHRFGGCAWWDRVYWHGWLNDPRQFLTSLHLLICPSTEFDPFPTVLLESAQLGIPALAACVGGVAEIIAANQTGWVFDPSDPPRAASILEGLARDPNQCLKAGRRAQRRVEQEFPLRKMVAEYIDIYSNLLTHV